MDLKFFKKSKPTFIFLGIFSLIMIPMIYTMLKKPAILRTINPADINPILVDENLRHIRKNHRILDFHLTNQYGETITEKTFKNKIYVADFFFTTCTTICPIMGTNMAKIQEAFKDDDEIMLLSHSVTPKMDSVPVLKKYADKKGAVKGKWHLTTGDKKHIYELARKSYMVAKDDGNGDEYDFIHTENFVLVDPNKKIRGVYDGTSSKDIDRLIADIYILKKETKKN